MVQIKECSEKGTRNYKKNFFGGANKWSVLRKWKNIDNIENIENYDLMVYLLNRLYAAYLHMYFF